MRILLGLVLSLFGCGHLCAATLYVDLNSTAPSTPYSDWASAATHIQDAVDAAADGDEILVNNGHYMLDTQILVTKSIRILSTNGPAETIVDGQGNVRCFYIGDTACVIEGMTITNGYAHDDGDGGGGIRCQSAVSVITNCIIVGNTAVRGGGGMYLGTANNCTISGNSSAGSGGGVCFSTVNESTIIENSSADSGGGIYSGAGNNCIINRNSARYGGGMCYGTANNCFVSGNSATYGGGMYLSTANNCTISGNSAVHDGGGMYLSTANNCVVWYNNAPSWKDLYSGDTYYSCSPDLTHGVNGNITNAPMLVSWSHISTNSPCHGAGSVDYLSGTDIDGEAWQSPPSMGCDEYYSSSLTGALEVAINSQTRELVHQSVSFAASISGMPSRMTWDFGDGIMATNSPQVEHAWSTPGTYDVVLTAYNDTCSAGVSATQTVDVLSLESTAVYVSPSGSDANDGLSWATSKATIQAGVDTQSSGGWVIVSNGTYALTQEIVVNKEIVVRGLNGPEETIVDGQGGVRCFNLGDTACMIEGLTITNGYRAGNLGGGVRCSSTTPVITNCVITGNSADDGGGIFGGIASDCIIVGNSADEGGGIYDGIANNCIITANTARLGNGGGMYSSTANNCVITGNSAKQRGGGATGCTVKGCIITGNSASNGGGVSFGTANNCTVTGNTASNLGGGVYQSTVNNCIVWYNNSPLGTDLYRASAHYSCSPDLTHGVNGNITNAPCFVDYENGDYRLKAESPCVNAGTNAFVFGTVDLDGNLRVVDSVVDMGAYEYQTSGGTDTDADGDGMPDEWELTYFSSAIVTAATDDPDHDGLDNLSEWIVGSDPTNSVSCFSIRNSASEDGFTVEWSPCIADRLYRILWSDSLTNSVLTVLQENMEYPQNSYTDFKHNAAGTGFYRVDVRVK